MVCPSCGTPNSHSFNFCPECGQRLAPAAASPAAPVTAAVASSPPAARMDEAAQAAHLLDQAFQSYDDGQYDEALGCCQASLALDPEGSTAHSLLVLQRLPHRVWLDDMIQPPQPPKSNPAAPAPPFPNPYWTAQTRSLRPGRSPDATGCSRRCSSQPFTG